MLTSRALLLPLFADLILILQSSRQLKKAGHQTTLASNGVEALDAIKKLYDEECNIFDVILMGE